MTIDTEQVRLLWSGDKNDDRMIHKLCGEIDRLRTELDRYEQSGSRWEDGNVVPTYVRRGRGVMTRDEMQAHVAATIRRALHDAYRDNADPYEDDPLRFGVSFPDGFVEVAVVDAPHPDDEYEQVGWRTPSGSSCMYPDLPPGLAGLQWEPVYRRVKREPAPQAEPDRCPTCGSDDPERYDDGCQDTGQPLSMTIDGDLVYGKPDPWHTEGADR